MAMRRFCSFLIIVALIFGLPACAKSVEVQWQEQYDLGIRYLSDGNYEEAIIAFTAAIEIDPNRAEAYVGRGDTYVASGETEENLSAALADYEAALELDETLVDAWLGLADVYIRLGEYDIAMEVLQEGLEATGNALSIADKIAEIESGRITDSWGNLRQLSTYDSSGVLIWRHTLTYDIQGRQTSITSSYNKFQS